MNAGWVHLLDQDTAELREDCSANDVDLRDPKILRALKMMYADLDTASRIHDGGVEVAYRLDVWVTALNDAVRRG